MGCLLLASVCLGVGFGGFFLAGGACRIHSVSAGWQGALFLDPWSFRTVLFFGSPTSDRPTSA